jgi:hypothetical protein
MIIAYRLHVLVTTLREQDRNTWNTFAWSEYWTVTEQWQVKHDNAWAMLLDWKLTENKRLDWKIWLNNEKKTEVSQNAEYTINNICKVT